MITKFAVIKSRLEMELENIARLHKELETRNLIQKSPTRTQQLSEQFMLRAIGSIFHDFYTSIENMFKIIARYVDTSLPDSPDWHLELLQQMSICINGVRPAIISSETFQLVNEYRSFRHVFRNIYGFNLVAARLERLLDIFQPTIHFLTQDIRTFLKKMEETLQ